MAKMASSSPQFRFGDLDIQDNSFQATTEGRRPQYLTYQSLFTPIGGTFGASVLSVLLLLFTCAHHPPYSSLFAGIFLRSFTARLRISRPFRFLSKISGLVLVALAFVQEINLQRNLLHDFRAITGGSWAYIDGVVLHYLLADSPSKISSQSENEDGKIRKTTRLNLFHGFGSNSLSWSSLLNQLRGVRAIAHDYPGFGFNPRKAIRDAQTFIYRPLWNARANRLIRESIAYADDVTDELNPAAAGEGGEENTIFMGHSMGAVPAMIAAADAVLEARGKRKEEKPQSQTTLVLLGPAITLSPNETALPIDSVEAKNVIKAIASATRRLPLGTTNVLGKQRMKQSSTSDEGGYLQSTFTENDNKLTAARRILKHFVNFLRVVPSKASSAIQLLGWRLRRSALSALTLPLKIFLRRVVHSRGFWFKGLGASWGWATPADVIERASTSGTIQNNDALDAAKKGYNFMGDQIIWRYRLASMAKGFEADLFRFTKAQAEGQRIVSQATPVPVCTSVLGQTGARTKDGLTQNLFEGQNSSLPSAPSSTITGDVPVYSVADSGGFPSAHILPGISQAALLSSLLVSGCRIVILHGANDPLVPINNSRKVAELVSRMIRTERERIASLPVQPGANVSKIGEIELVELPYLGHVPHEENPTLVLDVLDSLGVHLRGRQF